LWTELDRVFAAVAESVKELVMAVQSWNLTVRNEHQRQRSDTAAKSYESLCQSARTMGAKLPGADPTPR
jgi:hypothetical protein